MKYCSKCKKVYPDGIDCECTKEKAYSWEKATTMVELDCEPKCKCGSVEDLKYHPLYKYMTIGLKDDPSYCRCDECDKRLQARIAREESMKYLILDYYKDENKLCDSKDDVEEYLEEFASDCDRDSGPLDDVLILKLEPVENPLKESDFKPVFENRNPETDKYNREPNNHIVIWDGEVFMVEECIVPELEYEGGRSINW